MAREPRKQPGKRSATPAEQDAMDKLARAMSPESWAEYDAGNGKCTNEAGWDVVDSIEKAKRLIRAFPGIIELVTKKGTD